MVRRLMVIGMIVTQVSDAGLPLYEELTLACVVAYPIKVHVNCFRSFLFNGVVGKSVGGGFVYLDWRGRLWLSQFTE